MSFSDRAQRVARTAVTTIALLASLAITSGGTAQAQSTGDEASNAIGLQFGVGGATITSPNDEVGDPTLLAGSAFTGPMFRGALTYMRSITSTFAFGAELGLGRYSTSGFAEIGERRREIEFHATSLDVLVNARVRGSAGTVRPMGSLLLGGRFGVAASATERRTGFTTTDPAVAIETHGGFLLGLEGGVAIRTGSVEIPIAFRALNNLTYGRSTEDRLDGYRNVARPGNFQVESNWTYGLNIGVALTF